MNYYLAIDQSTSATKAILFNPQGRLVDMHSLPHRQIFPRSGWVEHDAEEIFANTRRVILALLEKCNLSAGDLISLSITNQRETFVIFDRRTGQPLHNAIVWQCSRGESVCQKLELAGHGDLVRELTGLKIDTYFPASKIRWLLDEYPELRKKLTNNQALIGTIDTYLVYRLTNGRVYATDHTNASRTLLYDINQLDWSPALFSLFGVPDRSLPCIYESSASFGATDLDGALPEEIPISGVMGDSQAALFAQRCFEPGDAKVTFGSGSSLLLNIGSRRDISARSALIAVAWVIQKQPTYALEGITNFTGATIAWLCNQLQLVRSPAETEELALSVTDNDGVYLVPAFAGLSAPYWRPNARAAIVGLSSASTRAHVARAALESISYIVKDALDQMRREAKVELKYIHADGGATKNQFLMQFTADITRLHVQVSKLAELSALGAVLSAMLGQGSFRSLAEIKNLPLDIAPFTPRMEQESVDRLLEGWRSAVNQVINNGIKR
ncbi:MAG: glycerol kinase GlpK [Chloroflexota bacterium]